MSNEEEALQNELDDYLNKFVDRIFELSQTNLVRLGKIDTGTLLKSGNINRAFLEKEIVYTAPYAESVEYGSTAHHPPVDPLIKWVERKLGLKGNQAKSVAWAIAKSIEERGMEQAPFLRPAFEKAMKEFNITR